MSTESYTIFLIVVALVAVAAVGTISYALAQQQPIACRAPVTPAVWHTEAE